jgi:outer membrane biosynthesis protein TonB
MARKLPEQKAASSSEVVMEWNRKTSLLAGFLFVLSPCVFGQLSQNPPAPQGPDELGTQELVAWSRFQKPNPVPEPLPPPDKGIPQPDPQNQQPPAQQPPQANQAPQQSPTQSQTFTGKIVKDGDKYVLHVSSGTSYQLDEQGGAKQYENKDVKVVGTLDAVSNTIHVTRIDLLS